MVQYQCTWPKFVPRRAAAGPWWRNYASPLCQCTTKSSTGLRGDHTPVEPSPENFSGGLGLSRRVPGVWFTLAQLGRTRLD